MIWRLSYFPSGSLAVGSEAFDVPHYRLGYAIEPEGQEGEKLRYEVAKALEAWLNGADFHDILKGGTRTTYESIRLANSVTIYAGGPFYDAKPPTCQWHTKMDDDSKIARWELIEAIWRQRRPS